MRTSALKPRVQKRGSVYVAVAGVAVIVSMVGLTAMHLSRLELRRITTQQNADYARSLAYSSVEFALGRIGLDSDWRENYTHNEENSTSPVGLSERFAFKFIDNNDGDLDNGDDDPVEIQGIGRWGNATFVYSTTYAPAITSENQVGPLELLAFTGGSQSTSSNVTQYQAYAQYFVPNLPAEAIDWSITSVQISVKRVQPIDGSIDVGIYLPDGSLKPGTLIETKSVSEAKLANPNHDWESISFSSVTKLNPAQGLCLTITSTGSNPSANIQYEGAGVSEPNAHMLFGSSGSWSSPDSSKSLFYRINGVYTTTNGDTSSFQITPGSWKRVALP